MAQDGVTLLFPLANFVFVCVQYMESNFIGCEAVIKIGCECQDHFKRQYNDLLDPHQLLVCWGKAAEQVL